MKKVAFVLCASAAFLFASCNNAEKKDAAEITQEHGEDHAGHDHETVVEEVAEEVKEEVDSAAQKVEEAVNDVKKETEAAME